METECVGAKPGFEREFLCAAKIGRQWTHLLRGRQELLEVKLCKHDQRSATVQGSTEDYC